MESDKSGSQLGPARKRKGMSYPFFKKMFKVQCVRTVEFVSENYALSKMRSLKKMHLSEQDVNREPLNVDEGVANLASSKLLEVRKEIVENPTNEEHETDSKILVIERKCLKRQKRLMRKHREELQELKRTWEEKKQILVKNHGLETTMVRSLFAEGSSTRTERLKRLENIFQMKLEEHNLLMEVESKNLVKAQDAAMKEEKQKAECWLGVAKSHSSEPTTVTMLPGDATGLVTDSSQLLEDQSPNGSVYTQGNDAENPAPKFQSVEFTTEARKEVPQTAQNENVSLDKNKSSSAEQLNQTESVLQSQPNLLAEVAFQEPEDDVTTVQQSSGVLEEGELQEVELQVEDTAPTLENQRTVNSESVLVVDPMPITEQPDGNLSVVIENQSQHTSTEIQAEVSRPVDCSNHAMSDVELQNQHVPDLENGRNSVVANSDLVDTVGAAVRITEKLHAEPPTVENQSTPISETAENVIHLQSNVEGPGSDQGGNSSQIAEVTGTELLRDEPVPQKDLNMRSVYPQSIDVPTSSQNNVAVTQTVNNAAEPANEDILQEGINVNHYHRSRLFLNPAAHQLPSLNRPPFVDPLHYELEKMTKEKDQLQKSHVDMVAHLKSDCEKEIEEMTNQIRQKYQMKLQEAENEHTIRKTEVEMNIKKLQANMKLAEAFRYKCLDVRLPGPSGNHQGASSSGVYMQQMRQLSLLPLVRHPVGASSTFQPSISQQNQSSIIQPTRPHPMGLSTVTSHSATATPVQYVQHTPSPHFATRPSRPRPFVSSITPHNPHIPSGELRSPAPHIQSVSPAPHLQSISPAPHLQSLKPSAGPPVPPTTSASRLQYQPLILPHAQNVPGPRGRLPTQPNQSTPAVTDRGSRVPVNTASVSRGVSSTCSPLGSSEAGVVGNVHSNRSPLPVVNDVICLSDDE